MKRKISITQACLGYNGGVGSVRYDGILFVAFSNDHPPPHVHAFVSETEVIVDLRLDGSIALANRKDAVQPANTKRSDVRKILKSAARILKNS